jgi:hypothetical protein
MEKNRDRYRGSAEEDFIYSITTFCYWGGDRETRYRGSAEEDFIYSITTFCYWGGDRELLKLL